MNARLETEARIAQLKPGQTLTGKADTFMDAARLRVEKERAEERDELQRKYDAEVSRQRQRVESLGFKIREPGSKREPINAATEEYSRNRQHVYACPKSKESRDFNLYFVSLDGTFSQDKSKGSNKRMVIEAALALAATHDVTIINSDLCAGIPCGPLESRGDLEVWPAGSFNWVIRDGGPGDPDRWYTFAYYGGSYALHKEGSFTLAIENKVASLFENHQFGSGSSLWIRHGATIGHLPPYDTQGMPGWIFGEGLTSDMPQRLKHLRGEAP